MPKLTNLQDRKGFTLDFWIRFNELTPGQVILDARAPSGKGLRLTTSERFTIKLAMSDGQKESVWDSDPGTHEGTLKVGVWQHVAVTVDSGPKLITFVVDGVLNDGGSIRQFGWGRFDPELTDVNGANRAKIASNLFGELKAFRIYNRDLRTSEAVDNFRVGG